MVRKKGFTLVELLAVICIIGVVAVIATPIVKNYVTESKTKGIETSIANIERAVLTYFNEHNIKNTMAIDLTSDIVELANNNIKKGLIIGNRDDIEMYYIYKDGYCAIKENGKETIKKTTIGNCDFSYNQFEIITSKVDKSKIIGGYRIYGNTVDNVSLGENNTITLKLNGKNMFDISNVISNSNVINNGNGTLSVTPTSTSAAVSAKKPATLKDYAPYLEIGKTYVLSANTTGDKKFIYLGVSKRVWNFAVTTTINEDDLNSNVFWYANGTDTSFTATISNIQIEEGSTATAYEPYLTPQEYTITLNEPLRKYGNAVDYIDSSISQVVRNVGVNTDGTLYALDKPTYEYIKLPSITNLDGTTVVSASDGTITPSKIEVLIKK